MTPIIENPDGNPYICIQLRNAVAKMVDDVMTTYQTPNKPLDLRTLIASGILRALLARKTITITPEAIVRTSVKYADLLLEELSRAKK